MNPMLATRQQYIELEPNLKGLHKSPTVLCTILHCPRKQPFCETQKEGEIHLNRKAHWQGLVTYQQKTPCTPIVLCNQEHCSIEAKENFQELKNSTGYESLVCICTNWYFSPSDQNLHRMRDCVGQ